jgi:multiple sugar transport system substrate-binding protein
VAAAEAWRDLHPDVVIHWDRRSLWGFGEGPLDEVARTYDLVVFDHPFTGQAAARGLFLPLDEHLPPDYLDALKADSAGPSHSSYSCGGHQWGLPVDAASQIAVCRPDLLADAEMAPPRSWDDVIALAHQTGKVRAAFSPMGTMGMFCTLCAACGHPAFDQQARFVETEFALQVLDQLRALYDIVGKQSLDESPVRVLGAMSVGDGVLYAPLVYGYSNYCRDGFVPHKLEFLPIPCGDGRTGAILGGAGMAVSAFSAQRDKALEFAAWVCGTQLQSTLYLLAGGQPGLRSAWRSELATLICGSYFATALPLVERAFVRPNYDGFTAFQSAAAQLLHGFLKNERSARSAITAMNVLYRQSWTRPGVDVQR